MYRLFFALVLSVWIPNLGGSVEHVRVPDAEQSRIEVMVRWPLGAFVGKLERYESKVVFDEKGKIGAASLRFRFTDLHTGRDGRDRAMYDWGESSRFPVGDYELSAIAADESGGWVTRGRLRFHGAERELVFPVSVVWDDTRWAIDGETPVDVRGFNLTAPRLWGVLKVDPVVRVRFHLQGLR